MASVLSLSARGASFLILIQVVSRALTFILNQLLLRYLSPELLGVSAQLELYTISALYFSRESLRVALQRPTSNTQAAVNIAYVPITLSVPLSFGIAVLYIRSSSLPEVPSILDALSICGIAAVIELASEPCFAVVQQKLLYGKRAAAEASAAVARAVVTYAAVVWYHRNHGNVGVFPFAFGLLAYGVVLSTVYIIQMIPVAARDNFSLRPKPIPVLAGEPNEYIGSHISRNISILGLNLYLQSAVKYILTQGDSLIITSLSSLHDQGTYALATNYGGLIARIIFQPIEESSRNLFAKLCATTPADKVKPGAAQETKEKLATLNGNPSATDPSSIEPGNKDGFKKAALVLETFLHLYIILALVSCVLGPHLAPHLLRILAGPKWSTTNASDVLATYTYYIPIMAINGVTEAFVAAVATNADLRRQSVFLGFNFVVFAISAWHFVQGVKLGAAGLVWACCIGLGCRCAWNGKFILTFFKAKGVHFDPLDALPSALSCICTALSGAWLATGRHKFKIFDDPAWDDLVGIIGVAVVLAAELLVFERRFFMDCYRMLFSTAKGVKPPSAME